MLRDFKFLRRNSSKASNVEEIENVPVHPCESSVTHTGTDSSRPPLNTIQDPIHNPKAGVEHEPGCKSGKVDKTPTKARGRYSDSGMVPLRTPEKQAASARGRFGWGPESRDDGKVDLSNFTSQSSRGAGNVNTPRSCRTVGRAYSGYSECNSTQSTPTKSVTKPPNPGLCLPGGSRPPTSGSARMANFAALSKGVPVFGSSFTTVNSVDVPHFDLKEDPSFWMDHNVQVLIRVRPLNGMERSTSGYSRCLKQESAQCVTWIGHPETRFTFDHVACETIDQETIFRMVGLPMVENCLSGYNSCMFAYGQTGSGKTHTMLGEINELEVKPSPNRGITPRMFEFLFARIIAEEESRRDERLKYNCKCSFLEIYNEQITDLLDPSSTNLQLREDAKKGVYVENLSEFEVHTVGDILQLLSQGSSNRKVAATNMNRESSRSHSVFTCVIESRWEKDSTSNLRFARLNLVDLAGSERQKTSGAEGERLKEAANINKSLSTLGHVIMVLVDLSNAKTRHIPYRDSRLTFLLQDSLGGNSKTMIIANVSPSICCAAETLNTLKFAQRAKLIQNNAVVNEDSSGDVMALQHQILLLKEELAALKRHNISRSLSFGPTIVNDSCQEHAYDCNTNALETDQQRLDNMLGCEFKGTLRFSSKQLKSLETTLTGALRREKMAENSIKQLEAEMEQLNRLVRQREEETRCTKMMLKFREDKIQRMESVLGGLKTADAYLLEENNALTEEIQMLRDKVDKNPEVTRFAQENIRLIDQLRRIQDFYEEGERELLLNEVSALRDQLVIFLDWDLKQDNHLNTNMQPKEAIHVRKENDSLQLKLKTALEELEECKSNLKSCLASNTKLSREVFELNTSLNTFTPAAHEYDGTVKVVKDSILEAPLKGQSSETGQLEKEEKNESFLMHPEDVMNLQLEVDILRIILKEERSSRSETEEKALCLSRDLKLAEEKVLLIMKQCEDVKKELMEARSVIEALESQQLLSIAEQEDLRKSNNRYAELLHEQKLKINSLNEQVFSQVLRDESAPKHSEDEVSPLQAKLNKMQGSLEKAKRLNLWYQTDRACHASSEEETEEVRKQVEAETAEVIVCLQDELSSLQQQVHDSTMKERETEGKLMLLQTELKELQEKLCIMTECNKTLGELVEEKEKDLKSSSEEWELLTNEIEEVLTGGHEALEDASNQLNAVLGSFPQRRTWISEQLHKVTRYISEKELLVEELNRCLEDANKRQNDLDCMLRSLRGAALVINEAHQQDCTDKEEEILQLVSQLSERNCTIAQLENKIKQGQEQIRNASVCATVAFVIVNRFSEMNQCHYEALNHKDVQLAISNECIMQKEALLRDQAVVIDETEKQIQSLRVELKVMEERCGELNIQLSDEKKRATLVEGKLDEIEETNILKTREKLTELKAGVSSIKSCMNEYVEQVQGPMKDSAPAIPCTFADENCERRTGIENSQVINNKDLNIVEDGTFEIFACPIELSSSIESYSSDQKTLVYEKTLNDASHKVTTIILLKKEIESALESLKGVQTELVKLRAEKLQVMTSEKHSRKSIDFLVSQIRDMQAAMNSFESQFGGKMVSLDHKIQTVEESLQESRTLWFQKKRLYELELGDAKIDAAEKAAESFCILAAFEEAQHTVKEADIIINKLMIANETMKLEIEGLKRKEVNLIDEKNLLKNEVQSLQTINCQRDLHYADLEKQHEADSVGMKRLVEELQGLVLQVQTTFEEAFMSTASDFTCMKSQLRDSSEMMRSSLEDIWSEIISKDCAVSVLHVCHMGILLETVTGLNAENGLLYHGLCESSSIVSELREHNFKSRRELEMCRVLKGKLLADIKNSFDRISRKEDETGKLTIKLTGFEKRIQDLQLQEEVMLQRSNYMGSELTMLLKELDLSNKNVLTSLLDQEILLKEKDEKLRSQEEKFMIDFSAKDLEVLFLASELEQMALQRSAIEEENISIHTVLEKLKEELIINEIDTELKDWALLDNGVEVGHLHKEVEVMEKEQKSLLSELDQRNLEILQMKKSNNSLEQDIQLLKDVACSNDTLKNELNGLLYAKMQLSSEIQKLDFEYKKVLEDVKLKESALAISSDRIAVLESLVKKLKAESCLVLQDLEVKKSEVESSLRGANVLETENQTLKGQILSSECCISNLQNDLEKANEELIELRLYQSLVEDELCAKAHDLQIHVDGAEALKADNNSLKYQLRSHERNKVEVLNAFSLYKIKCINTVETVDMMNSRVIDILNERIASLQNMFQEICKDVGRVSTFLEGFECLENIAKEVISENFDLQAELERKDEVLEGLVFDMKLLQESTSNTKDQKDEIEELTESLVALENELEMAIAKGQVLEAQLQDKISTISSIELDISREHESVQLLSSKNCLLTANLEDALKAKQSTEEELTETREVNQRLEKELVELGSAFRQLNNLIESLKSNLDSVTFERDDLHAELLEIKKEFEMAQALADENEAIATEARQVAETRKVYAEDKEEEVKLLERSIEELESTVNVLESKIDMIKEEAERQRLQREELELEFHAFKQQMNNVKIGDTHMTRHLDEREKILQEALQQTQTLEKEIATKDAEIAQCKAHISELNLHAEAQAQEYKQTFKALEAMADQVKPDGPATHITNSSSIKLEKNGSKSRGSGSPFKCIGLGLVQQMKSERDEELTAGRLRIEELESLAASRQKEIFMLNTRLAAAESMTHDVIRDLLGLKLDMTSYASLLDNQQMQKITEKARLHNAEAQVQEQEVIKLKQQLKEFVEEKKGWLDEIDRKQAEMVAAQIALEKLRQRDRLLTTENEMIKMEIVNHKKNVMELEAEVKKLSGQQNLQQRIHHHAKIKEENNLLRVLNEDLTSKLRRTEAILSRVKEELSQLRAANGRSPYVYVDVEQQLNDRLKETEEERLQLAQKLVALCTSILKASGVTRPSSDVSITMAEEALEQLHNRVTWLERELRDVKHKNRINNERIRLSELMPQPSPLTTPNRASHTPFLSALDR